MIQLRQEGGGVCLWTTASQDLLVVFNQLTILSGQGYISEISVTSLFLAKTTHHMMKVKVVKLSVTQKSGG